VAPNCVSCHGAHNILPATNPAALISRRNIEASCSQCHQQVQQIHRRIIKPELWAKDLDFRPVCVDCHQPHRSVSAKTIATLGSQACLRCHQSPTLKSQDGRSMTVELAVLSKSPHANLGCTQCHTEVRNQKGRPCKSISSPVDCSSCHAEVGSQYATSIHGKLEKEGDPNAPTCKECHGTHDVASVRDPKSPTFPNRVPLLCAKCHREGQKAAVRYTGQEHKIVSSYVQSIHGKGLLKSGLMVTAMCTSCHTAHQILPASNPKSSVNRENIPKTCGRCHYGIEEQFNQSIHAQNNSTDQRQAPVCNNCHTSHRIRRADNKGFRLQIMDQCGQCHQKISSTYFDTYHGKVSKLGYLKTAKCYDCHGAHDILPVSDPRSHVSSANILQTCRKCHPKATKRFTGYLTHAIPHDREKYPFLFWTFWGMTTLLLVTFAISWIHTLLWLPKSLAIRRLRKNKQSLTTLYQGPSSNAQTAKKDGNTDGK